jgi:hypothetical protein
MKNETERRRHRLVFTALGPLTLSLLFAAPLSPANAADVIVIGTPDTPGVDGALRADRAAE